MLRSRAPGSILRRVAAPASVAAVFALSRALYALAGVRFDASSLDWFWQYLEPALLRTRFFESILNLHSQPPAMNVFLGIVLNLAPGRETPVFAAVFLLLGLWLSVGLCLLALELGVRPWLAAGLAALFAASPACVLYENWLFHTCPVAAWLVAAALFWARYLRTSRARDAVGLFAAAGLAALTWSVFHISWLAAIVAALLCLRPRLRRRTLVAAAVPLLLVTGWYAKNLALFGQFAAGTWGGMNFSKMTASMLLPEERIELHRAGLISGLSLQPPFSGLERYAGIADSTRHTGVPVLDRRAKPNRIPNYNNLAYVEIARRAGRDARRILRARPQAYLRGLAESWLTFFLPADEYLFLAPNRERVRGAAEFANAVLGRLRPARGRARPRARPAADIPGRLLDTQLLVVAAYVLLIGGGLAALVRRRWRSGQAGGPALLLLWGTVSFAALAGNALEVGENNRFRFALDPLVLAAFALLAERLLRRFARRRA